MSAKQTAHIEKTVDREKWFQTKHLLNKDDSSWIILDTMPWGGTYKPLTLASVSRDRDGFNIYMRSYEKKIRFEGRKRNDFVCQDSCMEFFFAPMGPEEPAYFNFEVNPIGVMYIGFSKEGTRKASGQAAADKEDSYFNMKAMGLEQAEAYNAKNAENRDAYWDIAYSIPFSLIQEYVPEFKPDAPDKKISANFYKCGDFTETEHYVVWNNIETIRPDYHRPEYFGILEL